MFFFVFFLNLHVEVFYYLTFKKKILALGLNSFMVPPGPSAVFERKPFHVMSNSRIVPSCSNINRFVKKTKKKKENKRIAYRMTRCVEQYNIF